MEKKEIKLNHFSFYSVFAIIALIYFSIKCIQFYLVVGIPQEIWETITTEKNSFISNESELGAQLVVNFLTLLAIFLPPLLVYLFVKKIYKICNYFLSEEKILISDKYFSYTRKLAEFQNFTKRKENEVAEMKKYASEGIITKLLDNIDNLERAEQASAETKNFDALVEGVNMILRNLRNLLTEEGVEELEAAEGVKFNPYEHQAMMTENVENLDDDVIVKVFQKGYKLKGKVIRPAMVTVNKK